MKLRALLVFAMTAAVLAGCASNPSAVAEAEAYNKTHATLAPITQRPTTPVAVIGDSYSVGTGAGDSTFGWIARLSRNQPWNVTNVARGGTGYVKTVTVAKDAQKACSLDLCPNYAAMIQDAAVAKPSLVIVSGGRNDSSIAPQVESAAIQAFYTELRAAAPDAKIVAFNALWDDSAAPASIGAISAQVKASVESVGGVYLDAGQPLSGHPELVATDHIHPNLAGHTAIFEANLAKLQAAGIAIR